MVNFLGAPYIDVRVSFNSFIPSDLDDELASRLVDFYLDKLVSYPNLHDKIEFEIVSSCFTFDLSDNLKNLENFGFSKTEQTNIFDSLINLTNKILHPDRVYGAWMQKHYAQFKFQMVKSSNLTDIEKYIGY